MKRKTILPLTLLLLATVVLSWSAVTWKSDKAFVYPDIRTFNSSNAGKRACRVPEEVAKNMTTRALVETVVTYPYLIDMYAFNHPDLWFQSAQNLPMIRELCARPDGLAVLKAEAAKAEDDLLLRMGYTGLIGCMERAAQQ